VDPDFDWGEPLVMGEKHCRVRAVPDRGGNPGAIVFSGRFAGNPFPHHHAGLASGCAVNLEKALRLSDRLGGHLVSGHIDGVGRIRTLRDRDRSWFSPSASTGRSCPT
jgi:hypothetical protein